MSLLAVAADGICDGDEVACLDESGAVVGGGVFQNGRVGMAVWGGAEESRFPKVLVFSRRLNSYYQPQLSFVTGDRCYRPNGVAVVYVTSDVGKNQSPSIFLQANPNPFNVCLSITYALSDRGVVLSIFDSAGRLMLRENCEDTAGTLTCDASSWPSGAYVVRAKNARQQAERLVQLVK